MLIRHKQHLSRLDRQTVRLIRLDNVRSLLHGFLRCFQIDNNNTTAYQIW